MANLKSVLVINGNKNLTISPGHKVSVSSSSPNQTLFFEDLSSDSISYLPFGSGYNQVSLFENSKKIEIGKISSTSFKTKMELHNSSSLNIISTTNIRSGIGFLGWSNTETTTIGLNTIYNYYYTEKAKISPYYSGTNNNYKIQISLTDNINPSSLKSVCDIAHDLVKLPSTLEMSNNCIFNISGSLLIDDYYYANLASRNLIVVSDLDNPYSMDYYYGESGLIIETNSWPTHRETTLYQQTLNSYAGSVGLMYNRYRYTFTYSTNRVRPKIHLYKPGTSLRWSIGSTTQSYAAPFVFNCPSDGQWRLFSTVSGYQMNFTGQHKNVGLQDLSFYKDKIGLIVVSCGKYVDLQNMNSISVNQALPVIDLSFKRNQKNVFGVISNSEELETNERIFGANAWSYSIPLEEGKQRLTVNSLGEGGIWVCNINGNLENGDLITTCEIPGHGMRQEINKIANYTVAKITCDCDFSLENPVYMCEEFQWQGKTYRRAFVGCTYHCG